VKLVTRPTFCVEDTNAFLDFFWKILSYTIQYNTMENLHSKTDKHTVSLI